MTTLALPLSTAPALRRHLGAAGVVVLVAGLGLAEGGYFPTAWGWSGSVLCGTLAICLALGAGRHLSRLEWCFVGGLAGLFAWQLASALWSVSPARAVAEAQRTLVYVAAAAALLHLARSSAQLLGALLAGLTLVCTWALATRCFPDRIGTFDPVAGYRLAEPVGYWNALAILAVAGLLAAVAVAERASAIHVRAGAAATAPIFATTAYFTFSRGAWVALAVALVAALAVDPLRLRFAGWCLVLGIPSAVAVVLAAGADALGRLDATVVGAASQGRVLAAEVLGLAAGAALAAVAATRAERRITISATARRAGHATLAVAALAVAAVVLLQLGGPGSAVTRAYDAFTAKPPPIQPEVENRLYSFSGNGRAELWHAAARQFAASPVRGSGAGSYEQFWLQHREKPLKVRDAHSLYLETLAELGPLGLAALLTALAAPIAAAWRTRRSARSAPALAVYVAVVVHAAFDWDWEVPAVIVTALVAGAALLSMTGSDLHPRRQPTGKARVATGAAAAVLAAFSLLGLAANTALAASARAAADARWTEARRAAARAVGLAPWASAPLQALGRAHLAAGEPELARRVFEEALVKSPDDWELWFDLARASEGSPREAALAEAAGLNPLSPEIARLRDELRAEAASAQSEVTVDEPAP